MFPANKFFKYCIGAWHIKRVLGDDGVAKGMAKFWQQSPKSISYREDIEVKQGGALIDAYQEYTYTYDNYKLSKNFIDGRLFYELNFENNKAYGAHDCGMDNYKATYTFFNNDRFVLSYKVIGPEKNYTIETEFTRC